MSDLTMIKRTCSQSSRITCVKYR